MKKMMMILMLALTFNTNANFPGFEIPDFDELDAMAEEFAQDAKMIKEDPKVIALINFVETQNQMTCVETNKVMKPLVSFYITYKCDNSKKLKIRAKIKNDEVIVIGYKLK